MKYVISGATGLIGQHLINHHLSKEDEVVVLSRSPDKKNFTRPVQWIIWDGKTLGAWIDALEGSDVVLNLAGENIGGKRWTESQKEKIKSSRVKVGKVLAEAINQIENKPKIFIQASAIGYYGTDLGREFSEKSPSGNDFLSSVARAWESSIDTMDLNNGRKVIVRIGVVLDKKAGALPKMALPFKLFAGGPLGSGKQWVSWIDLDDVCSALMFISNQEKPANLYNLVSPNPVRNAEFGKQIAASLKRPYWIPVPGFLLRGLLGEMSTLVLDGQKVTPNNLLEQGFSFNYSFLPIALEKIFE